MESSTQINSMIAVFKQVMQGGHPAREVAARLGISIHSLYAWTKRYGVPEVQRAIGKVVACAMSIDKPTTRQVYRSITIARCSQPSLVRMAVMSSTQIVLGALTSKLRLTRFSAGGCTRCIALAARTRLVRKDSINGTDLLNEIQSLMSGFGCKFTINFV